MANHGSINSSASRQGAGRAAEELEATCRLLPDAVAQVRALL